MKEKIKGVIERLKTAVHHNPAEMVLSFIFFVFGCLYSFDVDIPVEFALSYFPAFFLTTCTLNYLTEGRKRLRWLYYLSVLFFIPFLGWDGSWFTTTHFVTMIVFQLIYLVGRRKKENPGFVREVLLYLRGAFSALLLSSIIWLLLLSIYMSIHYIFEIWDSYDSEAISCITSFSYLLSFPLLFLMFNVDDKGIHTGRSRLFDVLLNYVLSPALLIYAVILYLYFIKILVLWSLPKGWIAYIVVSFTAVVFLLKGCQPFLRVRYYDWFYRYASWIVMPALLMYWVGACYRINEYGFTEPRVYLVVTGVVLTAMTLLFFSKRAGLYYYIALLAIILLSAVTYVPGISAEDIEHYSQAKRVTNDKRPDYESDKRLYIPIESHKPVDIRGFRLLYPVSYYEDTTQYWFQRKRLDPQDSIFFFSPSQDTLYVNALQTFFDEQMRKAGLSVGDSIPDSAFEQILQLDMDSAVLIFGNMNTTYDPEKHTYEVDYLKASYYLKK